MFESLLTVRYITSKNCFCLLSLNNLKQFGSIFIRVTNDERAAYFTCEASPEIGDDHIGINSLYAKLLDIGEHAPVLVSSISKPPTIQSLALSASTNDDYNILELLAENVQSTLLQQIRVLHNGQKIVIWIGGKIHVAAEVSDINLISPGYLENLTEVTIKPPGQKSKKGATITKRVSDPLSSDLSKYLQNKRRNLILRVVPWDDVVVKAAGELTHPFNIFTLRCNGDFEDINTLEDPFLCKIRLLKSDCEKSVTVRLYLLEDLIADVEEFNYYYTENVFVCDSVINHFPCETGARIALEPLRDSPPEVTEIEISSNNYLDLETIFQRYLADTCSAQPFVLNPNVIFNLTPTINCSLKFHPTQNFCLVTKDFVREIKLSLNYEKLALEKIRAEEPKRFSLDASNYRVIVDDSLFLLRGNPRNNILVTGKAGSGKSTLAEIIMGAVAATPLFLHVRKISCKKIKGKTIESLHKFFVETIFDLIHHQPALLVIDDLHILCESVNEGDAMAQNAVYSNRVSEMLEGLFRQYFSDNLVAILATATTTLQLNKNIYSTRGNHLFKNVYTIEDLDKRGRKKLLEFLLADYNLENIDLVKLAGKTESLAMQDLVDLSDKAIFELCQDESDVGVMTWPHLEAALASVALTSFGGASLQPPPGKTLCDIGGLTPVKSLLIETMLWPSKYPNLFSKSPLRLPSGLLLYGPPGTGKTIVAGAAARHCGLRLISIKGPELLSKYIGASEQAVRDVFQRAQGAKPCVLFFDEFDSLAPRRGHDSTGVTDRVVNQLLTQLDGVESLTGVFVLAATSRPDLLDPALLRPGRLDRHVLCPLPDEPSRLEILEALSKPLQLAPAVALGEIARGASGFTGADLQAVLYGAQVAALEVGDGVEVNQGQLVEALAKTRPSLSASERKKYEVIYRRFEGGGSGDFKASSRATLA